MAVEEPFWIELENERDMKELEAELQHYLFGEGECRFPKMLVMVIGDEN